MVATSWKEGLGESIPLKIATVAEHLTSWAATTFGNVKKNIKKAEAKLKEAQCGAPDQVCWRGAILFLGNSMSCTG